RDAGRHRRRPRVPGAALPAAGRRAAPRGGGLPVRSVARFALHHRPASLRPERLDRGRRFGTRLQDGAGDRRTHGRARAHRIGARSTVHARPPGLATTGRLGGEMVLVRAIAAAVLAAPILLAQTPAAPDST